MRGYRIVAVDQFDRLYNRTFVQDPIFKEHPMVLKYYFEIGVREILVAMGTDAIAEWWCEPVTYGY